MLSLLGLFEMRLMRMNVKSFSNKKNDRVRTDECFECLLDLATVDEKGDKD